MTKEPVDFKSNRSDWMAVVAKGVLGAAPFVGPLVAEVVGSLIPNQRLDRLIGFVRILEEKIAHLDQAGVRAQFREPAFIDLLEDGFQHAARASSSERRERIASVIANGMSNQDVGYVQSRHLLWLLGELNDVELLILYAHHDSLIGDHEFFRAHGDVVGEPPASMTSSRTELDKLAIHQSYKNHLVRLGLLRPRFRTPKRGELPEFDIKTGMVKASGYDVAPLGALLLRSVALIGED